MISDERIVLIAVDLVAMAILVFGIFIPRFYRRDVAVSLCTLNVGVLSVSILLTQAEVSAGLGLGLFGLLSIVRLRSDEMTHAELAFYFCALIFGMVSGIAMEPIWVPIAAIMTMLTCVLAVGHPRFGESIQARTITLDRALVNTNDVKKAIHAVIDGSIVTLRIRRIDMINDSTVVEVRYRENQPVPGPPRLDLGPPVTIDLTSRGLSQSIAADDGPVQVHER